jgi:hypothetical protein
MRLHLRYRVAGLVCQAGFEFGEPAQAPETEFLIPVKIVGRSRLSAGTALAGTGYIWLPELEPAQAHCCRNDTVKLVFGVYA